MASYNKSGRVLVRALALVLCCAFWAGAIVFFMSAPRREKAEEVPQQQTAVEPMPVDFVDHVVLDFDDLLVWQKPTGEENLLRIGSYTIDLSHLSEGYFLAKQENGADDFRLRVVKGDSVYTYDLKGEGEFEAFPLQLGDGTYDFQVYKNVVGTRYSKEAEARLDVELDSEYAPFLCSSEYVYYTDDSPAVKASLQLCEGAQSDEQKLRILRTFIRENFTYDHERARTIRESYRGDADMCFETRTGLCQDFAVMLASMLRVQGIPTKMVIGYTGDTCHAWNMVLIDGEYRLVDVTAELGGRERFSSYSATHFY